MHDEARLSRKLTPLNVASLALGCIIGGSCFILPGTSFLPAAGPAGVAIAMAIAAAVMIVIAFNYSYMVDRLPYAGGEFTYTREAFGKRHAFVCAWFLSLSYVALVPLNATALGLMGRTLFGRLFQFGLHYQVAGYDIYLGEILLAYAALAFFAYSGIKGVKVSGLLQTALVFALVGGVGAVILAAFCTPAVKATGLEPVFAPGKGSVGCIIAILVVSPYCFVGFDTIPQSAEEFRFSTKKVKGIMAVAIIFGALVYMAVNLVTAAVVPEGYGTWAEYINDLPNTSGLLSMPTFHAAYQLLGKSGLFFLGIAVFAACLTGIIGFYMASSRLLYSMAKEQVIPRCFGMLSNKGHTPKNAILFVFGISLLGPLFGRTVLGWIVDMSSLGAAIGYGYTSAAAFHFSREEGNNPVMWTGALGVVMSVVFVVLLLIPIPGLGCSLGKEAYVCLFAWILIGVCFYGFQKMIKNSNR